MADLDHPLPRRTVIKGAALGLLAGGLGGALPGTAHSVTLAIGRQLSLHVTRTSLTVPAPIAT